MAETEFFESKELRGVQPTLHPTLSKLAELKTQLPGGSQLLDNLEMSFRNTLALHDKKVVISGSSKGIGFAVAHAMLEAGAKVVLNSFEPDLSPTKQADLERAGFKRDVDFFYVQADMTTTDGARHLVRSANEVLGGITTLVNNVGTYKPQNFLAGSDEAAEAEFDRLFAINVKSHIAASRELIKLTGGNVSIIETSSLNGLQSETGHVDYDISKAALLGLTRSLSVDMQKKNVRVNAICIGLVKTELTDDGLESTPDLRDVIISQIPAGRIGLPKDVTGPFVFLASDAAEYVRGEHIVVDGGIAIQQMMYTE